MSEAMLILVACSVLLALAYYPARVLFGVGVALAGVGLFVGRADLGVAATLGTGGVVLIGLAFCLTELLRIRAAISSAPTSQIRMDEGRGATSDGFRPGSDWTPPPRQR